MQLKFRHKVFLTLLLNSLVIVVCMLLISRYFASRNFENYINKVETARLNALVQVLSLEYQKSRSWAPVLDDLGHWLRLTGRGPKHPPDGKIGGGPPLPPPPLLPVPPMEKNPGPPKPPAPFSKQLSPPPGHPPGEPFGPPPGPPPGPRPGPHGMEPRFALFNAAKRPLTGTEPASPDHYQLKPVLVKGQVVGWVGMRKHQRLTNPLDVEFLRLQSQTFYTIGGVALLLAVLVTMVLSRHLLTPVRGLAAATRALTSRRFDTRIAVRSQDELGQLAADFNNLAQALERYEQMRQQWMADIAHELRTPLAILRGEIEAMQDGVREISREAMESLHFEVLHVSRIVQDLHDLSLIESPTFQAELTEVNPLEVLDETLRSFSPRFESQDLRIETKGGDLKQVTIMADGDRLKQLFSNLLENALRYVQAPGVLRIHHHLQDGRLILVFEDSGPGVPEESLPRLFDRLYRVDPARSRAQGGSGLGLAICKSIVEGLGGEIEAAQAPAGGLRITITLPVLSGGSAAPKTPGTWNSPGGQSQ
jgi:two-component system, OmpR family, sensor histidine kinase BaeS